MNNVSEGMNMGKRHGMGEVEYRVYEHGNHVATFFSAERTGQVLRLWGRNALVVCYKFNERIGEYSYIAGKNTSVITIANKLISIVQNT